MDCKKHKITNIQWPNDLYDRVAKVAKSEGMTFSRCVRDLCQTALVLLDPIEGEIEEHLERMLNDVQSNVKK